MPTSPHPAASMIQAGAWPPDPARAGMADLKTTEAAALDRLAGAELGKLLSEPGAVILVGRGERVLYRKGLGSRALVPAVEPMTVDTIFDLASLTKVVATTPAVLLLWEQERVDLDAPLGRYLKEFNTPAFRDVTVRRLLTHSAGLSDVPSREAMTRRFPEAARLQAGAGLAVTPGTTFLYSEEPPWPASTR